MATLVKYATMCTFWMGLFGLAFTLLNSRAEEQVLQLQQAIKNSQAWPSYRSVQTVFTDRQQELAVESVAQQDLVWGKTKARLTETEEFQFEMFFTPEAIYIHTLQPDRWNQTDYSGPVAGETQTVKDPFSFWLRLLKQAQTVEKTESGEQEAHYRVFLKPFHDEVDGIRLEDIETASMDIWTSSEPLAVKKMELHVQLRPNVVRRYDQIAYTVQFFDVNQAGGVTLPPQAQSAQVLGR